MTRLCIALLLVLATMVAPVRAAAAAQGTQCLTGEAPRFVFGFAELKAHLGDVMGEPVTCEFADPNGTGDVHQRTTTGLAFWRKATNTSTFTNGFDHWAQTSAGWVTWTGASIDPPLQGDRYPAPVIASYMQACTAASDAPAFEAYCRCTLDRIQARYTLAEFLELERRTLTTGGEVPEELQPLIIECIVEHL